MIEGIIRIGTLAAAVVLLTLLGAALCISVYVSLFGRVCGSC